MLFPQYSSVFLSSPYKAFKALLKALCCQYVLARPLNFMSTTKLIIIPLMVYLKTLNKIFNRPGLMMTEPKQVTNPPLSGL